MKKHTIIGTAGHIDHGKTSLIKALTGIDTDRLKEEKERGITIDIGFAYWKKDVTIIDVPGHEKFIRNMVAGVSTIDFFILVVAADDGIMPQTIEHLDILKFFNISDGLVVINKTDLVDEEWLNLINDEITDLINKYELKNIPVIKVSAITGINIDKFKVLVEDKIENHDKNTIERPFRLLVDRSFSVKGFGTVITGTVLSGSINVGDDIQVLPSKYVTKVRGLQEHTDTVTEVQAGDRAAINLQNIPKNGIERGDVLIKPGTLISITEFTGLVRTVSNLPIKIKNRSKVRIHVGTSERIGSLLWYEADKILMPNKYYHVRVKIDIQVAAARNDAFLIRLHSPMLTLAGGKILEINPHKIKSNDSYWHPYFNILKSDDFSILVENTIKNEKLNPVSLQFLQNKLFEETTKISKVLAALINKKKIRLLSLKGKDQYIHTDIFDSFSEDITQYISKYHKDNPHKPGTNLQEIIGGFKNKNIPIEVFESILTRLKNSGIVTLNQNIYSLKDFKLQISKDTETAKSELLDILLESGFETPLPLDISGKMRISNNELYSLIKILLETNEIIQIKNDFYLHINKWNELIAFLRSHFGKSTEIDVSVLKDFVNSSRKYAIPIFEYLDSQDITRRKGNIRVKGNSL